MDILHFVMNVICRQISLSTIFLLQFFSSDASAQSMTWLHQEDIGMQVPSWHDDSEAEHVKSEKRIFFTIQRRIKLNAGTCDYSRECVRLLL